jgi:hypothetical protein
LSAWCGGQRCTCPQWMTACRTRFGRRLLGLSSSILDVDVSFQKWSNEHLDTWMTCYTYSHLEGLFPTDISPQVETQDDSQAHEENEARVASSLALLRLYCCLS